MENLIFKNKDTMPTLGLGTWKSARGDVYNAVREAIRIGYRHIDCAPLYFNEVEVGKALKDAIEAGDVKREELWITSKLWCNAHGQERVIPALQQSLKDLQLEYLDLFLIHWPVVLQPDIQFPEKGEDFISLEEVPLSDTWKGMEKSVEVGLTRHIGVSNFSITKLKNLMGNCRIPPEMNQIELHPFLQQKEMLKFCKKENIHLTAYSPLGSRDRAPELKGENEPNLLGHPVINEIARQYQASAAQVLIRWAIQRSTAVIPKSVNPDRIQENFESLSIRLSDADMTKIEELDLNFRLINPSFWEMEGSPYTLASIWDE